MTFVGEGGADGGSVDTGDQDVSVCGCEAGSVGENKDDGYGRGINVCNGEDEQKTKQEWKQTIKKNEKRQAVNSICG